MAELDRLHLIPGIDKVCAAISGLTGTRCCRQRVGRGRSLSIGFGEKVASSKKNTADPFYGEWEIGTYAAAWRIVRGGQVLCGSMNVVDSIEELDSQLQGVRLGAFVGLEVLSQLDVRIQLDDGVAIDFICASTEDDEMFHIFGPDSVYLEYERVSGWTIGRADAPWTRG